MEKNIKSYLHLYLGCECVWEDNLGNCGGRTIIDSDTLAQAYDFGVIKPLLRRLDDVTEEEAQVFYRRYFGKDYADDWTGDTGSAYFRPKKVKPSKQHFLRIIRGVDYETGDFMTVVSLVPQLLRCGFDLFGLIDAGLAIEAIKEPNSDKNPEVSDTTKAE